MDLVKVTDIPFIDRKIATLAKSYIVWDKDFHLKSVVSLVSSHYYNDYLLLKCKLSDGQNLSLKNKKIYFALKKEVFSFVGNVIDQANNEIIVMVNKCVIEENRIHSRIDIYNKSYFGSFHFNPAGKNVFNFKIVDISKSGMSIITTKDFSVQLFKPGNAKEKLLLKSIQNAFYFNEIELIPIYSKVFYSSEDKSLYRLGIRFAKTYNEINTLIKKLS